VGGQDLKDIAEPAQEHLVWRAVERSALSAMDAYALSSEVRPRLVVLLEPSPVPWLPSVQSSGPGRFGQLANAAGFAVGSLVFICLAFFLGRRSFNETHRAQETWRSVDGHWLVRSSSMVK